MKIRKSSLATIAYLVALALISGSAIWSLIHRIVGIPVTVGLSLAIVAIVTAVVLDPARLRRALAGRQARYGSNMIVISAAFMGILIVLNYLIYNHPIRWDLTEARQYSLSPETLRVLEELPSATHITGFYTPALIQMQNNARTLLDQYRIHSHGKLDYAFVDPLERPMMAEAYGIMRSGSLVVTLGETSEIIDYATEQNITEALIRVMSPEDRKIYFLVGHGERDHLGSDDAGYAQAQGALQSKNYGVDSLNLLLDRSIPSDAKVVLVVDPKKPLDQEEVDLLSAYLDLGGSLILMAEPGSFAFDQEEALHRYLLTRWGIEVQDDVIVDLDARNYFYAISALPYANHPITADIGTLFTFFPTSRSLKLGEVLTSAVNRIELVQTGENSWGETNYEVFASGGQLEFNEGLDAMGPLTLAVVAEDMEHDSRLVLFGDTDFASNFFFYEYGNSDLFVNSVDWAVGIEQLISLTPKPVIQRFIYPPTLQTISVIFLVTVILIPGIVIASGIYVWWLRRKRAWS